MPAIPGIPGIPGVPGLPGMGAGAPSPVQVRPCGPLWLDMETAVWLGCLLRAFAPMQKARAAQVFLDL